MESLMICERAKSGECQGIHGMYHCKEHALDLGCFHACSIHSKKCVPVMPEYVRITSVGYHNWYTVGQIHKVVSESDTHYRVDDDHTIDRLHCEPYQPSKEEKETPIKYTQLKPISLEALWNAQPDKDCQEFLKEWAFFMNWMWLESCNSGDWCFVWQRERHTEHFLEEMKTHDHGPRWLAYMETHGFIKRGFEPFDVKFHMESTEDAKYMLRNFPEKFTGWKRSLKIQLKARGIEV